MRRGNLHMRFRDPSRRPPPSPTDWTCRDAAVECKGQTAFDHIDAAMTLKTHKRAELAHLLAGRLTAPDYYYGTTPDQGGDLRDRESVKVCCGCAFCCADGFGLSANQH